MGLLRLLFGGRSGGLPPAPMCVSFDADVIRLTKNDGSPEPPSLVIPWADIVQICFTAASLWSSDLVTLRIKNFSNPVVIPIEHPECQSLWFEILHRGLFDPELAIKAAMSPKGTFCWPEKVE